jgi:competence CoiA-like predicted nuclease
MNGSRFIPKNGIKKFRLYWVKFKDNQGNTENRKIEENTRVNFRFNKEKYLDFRSKNINKNYKILRTDKELFEDMPGTVVPKSFWSNAEQFTVNGIGFSLIYDNQVASTAFSAFIHDRQLELGIETISSCRGKGFAEYTCSALIDYCIDNAFEPIWSCRFENTGSFVLAVKLGFEPTIYIPYYRLAN